MYIQFNDIKELLERTVKVDGNSAKVNVPKQYLGRKVKILILEDGDEI